MWYSRLAKCVVILGVASVSANCATTKVVGDNIQRVANHQPVDESGLKQAVASDTKDLETNLQQLRRKFEEALAQLKTNVQKRWGQNDTKVADRTVYVKYTQ